MKTRDVMVDARHRLERAGVPDPVRDASVLLDAAGVGHEDMLTPQVVARFERMLQRRLRREPVSHITGRRAFWMHDFIVTPDVLDPRPDTETLVDHARQRTFASVLDLGTGSGCILASLLHEMPGAHGIGTDISEAALAVAARNLEIAGVADRATLLHSDWLAAVTGPFDLIVSNPPYISTAEMKDLSPEVLHEPHLALTPGGDGLDAYRAIARDAPVHLTPGGRLMVEIGATQGPPVADLFRAANLMNIRILADINGKNRVVSGEKPHEGDESTCHRTHGDP